MELFLAAMVLHLGDFPNTGHYIALDNQASGQWLRSNDDVVSASRPFADWSDAVQQNVRLVVYKRIPASDVPEDAAATWARQIYKEEQARQ